MDGSVHKNSDDAVQECIFLWGNELPVHDVLVFSGSRIVIPGSMRSEMLEQIHGVHQGLIKCRMRINT